MKLTGTRGRQTTECYKKLEAKSILEWKINFPEIPKPTIKAVRAWDWFKTWLKQIELNTVYGFKNKATSYLQISQCRKYYRMKEGH